MSAPEAVRKHDGRVVSFDSGVLAASIARAACAADATVPPDSARRVGEEIAAAVSAFLMRSGKPVPDSADIRTFTVEMLRQTGHARVADAYVEHARAASGLLWRLRVIEPGMQPMSVLGSPWDRRRLLESLCGSGVARDPAGEVARDVERRLVTLAQDRVSPALIHSMAALILSQRHMDTRAYNARRVAFTMAVHARRFDSQLAEEQPLPPGGTALEAFWLQAVHSPEVVRGVRDNLIALDPYPVSPIDDKRALGFLGEVDPLSPRMGSTLRNWCEAPGQSVWVRADGPERAEALSRFLGILPYSIVPSPGSGAELDVLLNAAAGTKRPDPARSALPITINAAGLVAREGLRDQHKATIRLSQLVSLVVQAHREREEYFSFSPVRGRLLPIAVAGVWNAAAWLQGESFDSPKPHRGSRALASMLIAVLRGAVETLRSETGMELCLAAGAPMAATRRLFRLDREYFQRDGLTLDANGIYDGGPDIRLSYGVDDLGERIDFARTMGPSFDEPPAVVVDVPLGNEPDMAVWIEFFSALAQAGIPRLRLVPGGNTRGMRNLIRVVRTHVEGYPLFDQPMDSR